MTRKLCCSSSIDAKNGHITVTEGSPSYSQFMLSVASDRNPLSPGERFTVSVCNDWGMSFASFDLSIHYDASMFRLEGQSPVVGEETLSTLTLDAGSGLAAADFELRYDPTLLECLAAEPAADARFLLINPNFSAGTIRFSFVTDGFTDPTGHHHEWFVMAAPTCTEDGLEEGTCTGCGELLIRAIPALGHDWDGTSCRRCGQIRENPFTDVPEGGWFTDAVLWALENGITEGTSAAAFSPGSQCLRAQVVTFLHRADRLPKPEPHPETP